MGEKSGHNALNAIKGMFKQKTADTMSSKEKISTSLSTVHYSCQHYVKHNLQFLFNYLTEATLKNAEQ